ncbi:MAG TPA: DUF2157 domain-containing protein [Acidimicrobiales bacterium]|nr:DUF2157 domain-containing protein [Acidimicrobiales bacterium]
MSLTLATGNMLRSPRSAGVAQPRRSDRRDALEDTLEEWRAAGLIRADEVEPILRYEQAKSAPQSRIPMAAEAVGYVGSALVITAIALLIGRRWDDIAVGSRIAVLAVPAMAAAAIGWWVGSKPDPAFARTGSVLWVLSAVALAGAMTVVFVDAMYDGDPPEHGGLLFVGGFVAVWAGIEYALRRLPLQQLTLFGALLVTVLGVVNALEAGRERGFSTIAWGLAVWAFGVAWTALGATGRLEPSDVARLVGLATVLFGSQLIRVDAEVFGLWMGLASAALLVAVGVWRTDLLVLLGGAVGLFQWSPQLAIFYLADALGTEVTLLLVGVLLLAVAFTFTRLYRRVRSTGQPPLART